MKLETTRENLLKVIEMAVRVSGKNLTLPVLNCVFLSIKDNILLVRSTNLDLGFENSIPIKSKESGDVAVPGDVFYKVISSINTEGAVTLQTEDNNLIIKTQGNETTIKTQSHDDFPTIPKPENPQKIILKSDVFVDGLRSVLYSASLSSIKPELASVYIKINNKKTYFVATDSFRLAEKTINTQGVVLNIEPFLIPLKNTPEIIRALDGIDGDIEVFITPNQISFSYGSFYITSRLVDGSFPDYGQIIPKEVGTEVVVLKQDIVNTLKKTSFFLNESNQVRFNVDPTKKQFIVSSKNNNIGEVVETLHASVTGDSIEVGFNHKYILDCFQSIHTDSVSLSFLGTSRPVVIRGVSDQSFLYLVMPMNK